jgi:hypothetical protein
MDVRRLGVGPAIPLALLKDAASAYLSDAEWDGLASDWLDAALADCARSCLGSRGPLTRIRPRPRSPAVPGLSYRLADHLEQLGLSCPAFSGQGICG